MDNRQTIAQLEIECNLFINFQAVRNISNFDNKRAEKKVIVTIKMKKVGWNYFCNGFVSC